MRSIAGTKCDVNHLYKLKDSLERIASSHSGSFLNLGGLPHYINDEQQKTNKETMKGTEHLHLDSVKRPNYDTVLWSKKPDRNEVMFAACASKRYLAGCHAPPKAGNSDVMFFSP